MTERTILLTGVSQGLGLYLCKALTAQNFKIVGIDLPRKVQLTPELDGLLTNYYSFDLSKTNEIPALADTIISENENISILINNAGLKSFKLLSEYSDDEFRKVVEVNFLAPVLLTKHLLPYMVNQQYGRIINIASNAGFEGYKTGSAYCSTKGALHRFTEALALELPNDITINAISPSTIATDEFLKGNPGIDNRHYIPPNKVSEQIIKIINSEINGKVFPLINRKTKVRYFIHDIARHIYWQTHS